MTCQITYDSKMVMFNNHQFSRLIDFALEIAEQRSTPEHAAFIERMKKLDNECFWPGRGIQVEEDFPDIAERKFWCRVFYDTSRAIFDRSVGLHDHSFWQTQAIHQAYGTGQLFESAIRGTERHWFADTIDRHEFHEAANKSK